MNLIDKFDDRYERSAIIGYWRSGATIQQIKEITGKFLYRIRPIIIEYAKAEKKRNKGFKRQANGI